MLLLVGIINKNKRKPNSASNTRSKPVRGGRRINIRRRLEQAYDNVDEVLVSFPKGERI